HLHLLELIIGARTRRRLARMAQSGEVSTAPELAFSAASHDIVHVSASTARNMLHQEGLKAMHTIKKPLLTREHKRRRLEWARAHRDWTVQQWTGRPVQPWSILQKLCLARSCCWGKFPRSTNGSWLAKLSGRVCLSLRGL
ncbi:hypothetical protein EON65_58305, partial [archaeon]